MNFPRLPQPCYAPDGEGAPAPAAPAPEAPAVAHEAAPPAAEPAKADEAPQPESTPGSLLSDAEGKGSKPEPKEEPAKVDGEKPAAEPEKKAEPEKAAAAVEPPPPEPLKYEFKVPDGMKLDGETFKTAEAILGGAQVPPEQAQKLIDLHLADMQRFEAQQRESQQKAWNEQVNAWKDEFRKDPDLGGNREATTLSTAKAVIEEFGGTKEQQTALLEQFNRSGMGNNLGLIRLLHNVGAKLGVFEDKMVASPTTAHGGRPGFGTTWYDKSKGNGASA